MKSAAPSLTINAVIVTGSHRLRGVLNELEHRGCIVDLIDDTHVEIPLDSPVYIELPSIDGARISGRLRRRLGRRVTIDVTRRRGEQQRYFPRVTGGLTLEYRIVPHPVSDVVVQSWMRGVTIADGSWYAPAGEVEFSPSGLRCEDGLGCRVGDLLLLSLQPSNSARPIRATARVVRTLRDDPTGQGVAMELVEIGAADLETLARHTCDRQRAALEED